MKKLLFLINPYSGKMQLKNSLLEIIKMMNGAGYEVTVWTSQYPKHITELVKTIGFQFDRIVCAGGDGTLNETVTGLMSLQEDQRPVLGYIPAGSTNDVAYGLRLPTNMLEAAKIAVSDITYWLDIGQFRERYFTYVAAFGAFTEVTYMTPQEMKNALGHPAYILEAAKRLQTVRPLRVKVTCGQESVEESVLIGMVSNAKSVGGMRNLVGKDVGLNDGLFEVTLLREPKKPLIDYPAIITALLSGKTQADPNFYTVKTSKITFSFEEPMSWVLDGEYGGTMTETTIINKRHGLQICVSPSVLES